jgi:hypothetical protein
MSGRPVSEILAAVVEVVEELGLKDKEKADLIVKVIGGQESPDLLQAVLAKLLTMLAAEKAKSKGQEFVIAKLEADLKKIGQERDAARAEGDKAMAVRAAVHEDASGESKETSSAPMVDEH